jgi:DNA gyrase subunit A
MDNQRYTDYMNNLIDTNLVSQVSEDYLAYSLATLSRALPDIYDGLIPARRRILQTMIEEGLLPSKPYVKCARTTGLTSAFYHPHGSAYGSLISMATPWNNTIPWIDCHGNVGSTVDSPAAERYVENRLTTAAVELLLQNRETWETRPNYDGSRQEAIRLDAKVPTVLLNGTEGISVGYSTKLPQHNLRDICNSVINDEDLYPDFPTGCQIIKDDGLAEYVRTGSGTLRLRAILEIGTQEKSGRAKERATLTFTALPPNTNPEQIGNQIKEALEKGKFDGVSEVIDLSDLTGDRIQIVAKPGVEATTLAKYIYAYTNLESTYPARNLCLRGTRPTELSSREIIKEWKTWRLDRLRVQFEYEQNAKETRHEIVVGLLKAIDKIDLVIKVIRAAKSPKEALIELVSNRALKFTGDQARSILEMKLRSLTNLDSDELTKEKEALESRLQDLKKFIQDDKSRTKYMVTEIKALGVRHGEPRRSALIDPPENLHIEKGSSRQAAPVARPRFIKIDMKRGVVEQTKGPRGAIIMEKTDKLITITEDGTIKKIPATYKGPLGMGLSPVLLAKKECEVAERKYLVVFTLENTLKAMMVTGIDLCKVTSKGKRLIPEGAELKHFGEGSYVVPWASTRKKKVELFPVSTKQGRPGAKGIKVAALTEIQL